MPGACHFPNQNFQGGGDELTRRAQEPLYLDGTPTPRDAPMFGQNWYATSLWTDFGLKFIDEARKANKPFFLYLAHNAPHFPLMAPAELIAKHRGKYKAGWDRLRDARYRRQIKMGLIEAAWPLSPREADSPAWESLSDEAKDRFDHLMAVYAAMVEAIDTSVGVLVKGLETRGALDNTLILFLADNGANAESGPDGRFNGSPPGGAELEPVPGHELGCGRQHSVPTVQALYSRRGNRRAARRALAQGHSCQPPQRPRASARPSHRRHVDARRRHGRELSSRVQRPVDPGDGRRQPAPRVRRAVAPSHAASLLGTRGQPRRPLGQLEARVDLS